MVNNAAFIIISSLQSSSLLSMHLSDNDEGFYCWFLWEESVHVCVRACVCACMRACVCACMRACMCVQECVCLVMCLCDWSTPKEEGGSGHACHQDVWSWLQETNYSIVMYIWGMLIPCEVLEFPLQSCSSCCYCIANYTHTHTHHVAAVCWTSCHVMQTYTINADQST